MLLPLVVYGTLISGVSGAAMVPGVWYDLEDTGVLFKLYERELWLNAVADFQLMTHAFNWDYCVPPFTQEHKAPSGELVTLYCGDDTTHITITHAVDA